LDESSNHGLIFCDLMMNNSSKKSSLIGGFFMGTSFEVPRLIRWLAVSDTAKLKVTKGYRYLIAVVMVTFESNR
jgi:hypothetical protein